VKLAVRVKPGFSRTAVGGCHGDELIVRVGERAVDGAATTAALKAVADALGLRPYEVTLVSRPTSRSKVLEIPDGLDVRVRVLLG
jgi:uncharacterized protein YggU (UPF0235/DUF167 family)